MRRLWRGMVDCSLLDWYHVDDEAIDLIDSLRFSMVKALCYLRFTPCFLLYYHFCHVSLARAFLVTHIIMSFLVSLRLFLVYH